MSNELNEGLEKSTIKNKDELYDFVSENVCKYLLAVPVLHGYNVIKEDYGQIFAARSDDNSLEQFILDGVLEDNETFEDRLNKVLNETKKAMIDSGIQGNGILFYKTLTTDLFMFKLYLQDSILDDKQIRQLNAYFVEPEHNCFYQISLAAPPLNKNDINDNVTDNIYERLKIILENIKYNDEIPVQ